MLGSFREQAALAVLVLAGVGYAGCAGWEPEPRARALAQELMSCETLTMTDGGESVWQASGCGREIWVACTNGHNEPVCVQVRRPTTAGDEVLADAATDTDETSASAAPASETASTDGASSGAATGVSASALPVSAPPPRTVDASVRAHLDAHADDVLACTGGSRVALRARWDAHGTVVLFLGGALARSAEEGCVRAAVGDYSVAEPGEGGEVLHLVRRVGAEPASELAPGDDASVP